MAAFAWPDGQLRLLANRLCPQELALQVDPARRFVGHDLPRRICRNRMAVETSAYCLGSSWRAYTYRDATVL